MKKIYHLANCTTCQRIINELQLEAHDFKFQEIKTQAITADQLDALKDKVGSYEALFSRRAMKYRGMGLHEKNLTEKDYRKYILEDYTFLKRPVILIDDEIFVGNTKKVIAAAADKLK